MKVVKIIKTTQIEELEITGVTLLSEEEYKKYKDLIPLLHDTWWLRSPVRYSADHAGGVDDGGYVLPYFVDGYYGVSPALKISNLESSNLEVGDVFVFEGHQFTIINEDYAQCHDIVGDCPFREDWESPDANNYENSDIKKWVENWAKEHGIMQADLVISKPDTQI